MFLPNLDDSTRSVASKAITKALQAVNKAISQRSIRRGGLQAWGNAGLPLKNLMLLSGHRSEDSLMRYLQWGRHLGWQALTVSAMSDRALECMQNSFQHLQ
jgi:hypothetical protein